MKWNLKISDYGRKEQFSKGNLASLLVALLQVGFCLYNTSKRTVYKLYMRISSKHTAGMYLFSSVDLTVFYETGYRYHYKN